MQLRVNWLSQIRSRNAVFSDGRAQIESGKAGGLVGAAPQKLKGFTELKRPKKTKMRGNVWLGPACGFISVILHWWKECSKAVYKH